MKRGMEKWSQLEDSLIDQVREHPILYGCNAKSYKHMLTKENKWRDIAASLGITRRDCKLKWKGIRDGYRRNKILVTNGKGNRKSKYNDDRLKFLASNSKSRRDSEPLKTEQSDEDEEAVALHQEMNEEVLKPQAQQCHVPVSYEKEILLEELRKGREERYELMRLIGSMSMQHGGGGVGDSITHSFFKSMADVVSQFPPHKVAEVRTRVCNLVSETEMQVLSECSPAEQLELSLTTDCARAPPTNKKTEFNGPEIHVFDANRR